MSFELVGVKLVADNAPQYFLTMQAADKAVTGFGSTAKGTFSQMPGLADIAVGAFHRVGAMAVEAFAQAGRAVAGFIKDSVSVAGDFEAGMNSFAAVAGPALDEAGLSVKDFRDQFIQLGKELPVSTADVQQAATEMIKGGIDPATIAAGGLKQNIQFAAAAMGGDLVEAATVSAKILGGWADQSATAEEKAALLTSATDLLTKAANASTVDVKELALGLYNVQGTAKTTGLSLEETTTALAELSPRFASSSEAGTSFKNFLVRLQPTTKPAIAAMNELGLMTTSTTKIMQFLQAQGIKPLGTDLDTLGNQFTELAAKNGFTAKETEKIWGSFAQSRFFDEATGKFVGVAKASDLLQEATKGLTDAQKVQALQTIFGNDAMNSAAAFAELGAQGFNDMTDAMAKTNGVQANATTVQQGYNVAMDNFKGSIEAAQITIGSALLPVLTDLFNNYLSPGINTLTTLAAALSGDADAFTSLTPPMQAVALTLEQLWTDVQTGIAYVQGLIASFQSTSAESSTLGGVLDDLAGIWNNLLSAIDAAAAGYKAIIDAVLPIVSGFIEEHGDEISSFFQETYDTIIEIINTALELYKAIVPPILQAIAKFISDHGTEIKAVLDAVWKTITAIIDIALTLIKGILKTALQIIQGDWSGAWETVKSTVDRVWEDIKTLINTNIEIIKGVLSTAWDTIKSTADRLWGEIKTTISTKFDEVVEGIKKLPDQVAGVGEAIVQTVWDGIKGKWDELVNWFNGKLEELRNQLPFSEPKDPESPLRGLKKSGTAMVEMIQEGINDFGPLILPEVKTRGGGSLSDLLGGAWGNGGGSSGGGGGGGSPWGQGIVSGIASAALAGLRASGAASATYNQQRSVALTYNTAVAPPVQQSYAIAQALVGGF